MTAVCFRLHGATSPIRTQRCSLAALLTLLLTAALPLAAADIDPNRLIFEILPTADILPDTHPALPLSSPTRVSGLGSRATNPALTAGEAANPDPNPAQTLAAVAATTERIATLVEQEGAFTPALIQEYLDLGRRYQALGRHEAAIDVLDDAEYLSRINAGLDNRTLIDIAELSIPSHLALGQWQEIARRQEQLYRLTREHYGPGSPELDPLLRQLAEWQLYSFRQGLRPQPVLSLNAPSIDPRMLAFASLYRAQRFYAEAIDNQLQRRVVRASDLLALERQFVRTLYLGAVRQGLLDNPDFYIGSRGSRTGSHLRRPEAQGYTTGYLNGRASFTRMHMYATHLRLAPLERARIMVEEADWQLLFGHHGRAVAMYRNALQYMQDNGIAPEQQAALLASDTPPQLPAFMPLPHSRAHFGLPADAKLQWQGWIEVSFELSRYGNLRRLRVEDQSEGTDKAVTRRLRRLLHANPFRPYIVPEDSTDEPPRYTLRYHYTLAPPEASGPMLSLGSR